MGDAGIFAAERAGRVGFDVDFAETRVESVVMDEAPERLGAEIEEKFERFHGLERADDARKDAENARFGAGRDGAGRRWFGQKAAVTRAAEMRGEGGELAFKLKNGAVNEWFFQKKSGVVGGETGREIVRAVENEIMRFQEFEGVFGSETLLMRDEIEMRVDSQKSATSGVELELADLIAVMDRLAVEVGKFNPIVVDDGDGSDARRGEVGGGWRAETAAADEKNGGFFEFFLAGFTDLRKKRLAGVSLFFLGAEHGELKKAHIARFKSENFIERN